MRLLVERQYITDAGGKPTADTLDHFVDNQQIMKTSKRRLKKLTVLHFTGTASSEAATPHAEASQHIHSDVEQPSDTACTDHTRSAEGHSSEELLVTCDVADVSARLVQIQHEHKFALTEPIKLS